MKEFGNKSYSQTQQLQSIKGALTIEGHLEYLKISIASGYRPQIFPYNGHTSIHSSFSSVLAVCSVFKTGKALANCTSFMIVRE